MRRKILILAALMLFAVGISVAQTGTDQGTSGTAATQEQGTTGAQDQAAPADTSSDTQAPAADANQGQAAQDQGGQLPQTASPLPLLALLGATSIGGGLLARRKRD